MVGHIFSSVHLLLNLVAICAGFVVLYGLLGGKLFGRSSTRFLQASLLASVTSFNLTPHRLLATEWLSMLSVYVAAAAVLAWRKHHLDGMWSSVFAVTATVVLYLNILVATAPFFRQKPSIFEAVGTYPASISTLAQLLATLLFTMLGTIAVRRFHSAPLRSSGWNEMKHRV